MGFGSIWHWVVVLVVVVVIFGTSKLKNVGKDLGGAVRGFKDGLKGEDEGQAGPGHAEQAPPRVIDGEVREKTKS